MARRTDDLTNIDLSQYGIKGDLPKLLRTVEARREAARKAGAEHAAARDAKASVQQRMTNAAAQAARDGAEPPDLDAIYGNADTRVATTRAAMNAADDVRQEAERAVQVWIREQGDAARSKARDEQQKHAGRTAKTLTGALEQLRDLCEVAEVVDALAPRPPSHVAQVPSVTPPEHTKLYRTLAAVLAEVEGMTA